MQFRIAPLAMGLGDIWTGTGVSCTSGGSCESCSISGQKSYFNVGEKCYGLVWFNKLTTAVDVMMYWQDANGNTVSSYPFHLGAPPAGQHWSCWKVWSGFDSLPSSLIGNSRIRVTVNGQWAGDKGFVVTEATKSIRIDATIKNTGTRDSGFIVGYMIDSALDWVKQSFSLNAGEQRTITFNTTAKLGSHTLYTRLWLSDTTYMDGKTQTFTV